MVRHTLQVSDVGGSKATGIAERLTDATLHAQISGIDAAFPPDEAENEERVGSASIVIDTTGDDDAIAAMSRFLWSESKTFISVSLGLHARRLFFFAANGTSFPAMSSHSGFSLGFVWKLRSTNRMKCPATVPAVGIRGIPPALMTSG